jgi:hypothetical protein
MLSFEIIFRICLALVFEYVDYMGMSMKIVGAACGFVFFAECPW